MNLKDIRIEYYKSSGPGGQHKNKSLTAVRIIHLRTGLIAVGQESRSQAQNKDLAMARLSAKVARFYARPRPRIATKKTRASRERRLDWKKRRSAKKDLRRVGPED